MKKVTPGPAALTPLPFISLSSLLKAASTTGWRLHSKICSTGRTRVSMRWYFSGPLSFRYRRMWSQGEWGSRAGRTGALKHDLLDLAVLELTARTSLIPRVIPLGHKLVQNRNAWTTSRHTRRIMKSPGSPRPSWLSPRLLQKRFQIVVSKSGGHAWRSCLILIGGRRPMERFALIRQRIWRCFMWWSTVNDFYS